MDEVPENLALHLVFNWDLPEPERVQNMIRVAANLRAAGYEVVDGYGFELVILPTVRIPNVLQEMDKLDYLVAIANPNLTSHNGRYGFAVHLSKIKFEPHLIWAKFADPDARDERLLREFLQMEGEMQPTFKCGAIVTNVTDDLITWEIDAQGARGNAIVHRFENKTGRLVFRPRFSKFRELVLEGHQPVAL